MNEELFQYIWSRGLFDAAGLSTAEGIGVVIFNRGTHNRDAGPDFSHARIRIGETDWYGHVELHLQSSDWKKHGHDRDPAYNAVILHVVLNNNEICFRSDGSTVPAVELQGRINEDITGRYRKMMQESAGIPCTNFLKHAGSDIIRQTLREALTRRMNGKRDRLLKELTSTGNNWSEVLYRSLARSMGRGVNSEAFAQLAGLLPLNLLSKHRDQLLQTEALVFGVAGFLENETGDDYYLELKKEWRFLQTKYGLSSMPASAFLHMRTRPGNFPGIRLAQFARLASVCNDLFATLISGADRAETEHLLSCGASTYWEEHYRFMHVSGPHSTALSRTAMNSVIINGLIPFLYVFATEQGQGNLQEKAMEWLESLPPEENRIIRFWRKPGIEPLHAGDTQAMLELKQNSCEKRLCLQCPLGQEMLRNPGGN